MTYHVIRGLLTLACASALVLPVAANAESFPARPITLIVPFPAGSQPDTIARFVAQHLSSRVGTTIIQNRPGAGGTTGTKAASLAAPDGYTLLLGTTGSLGIGPSYFSNAGYDAVRSFAPVAMVSSAPFMLVAGPAAPVATASEAIAYAKANPGKLSYSAATGTPPHLGCELFRRAANIDIHRVAARGTQVMTDLLAGEVHLVCEATTAVLPQIKVGQVKPLAVMHRTRIPQAPDVPTMAELGMPEVGVSVWAGVLAPAGTPDELVRRLNREINAALNSDELRDALAKLGVEAMPSAPDEFSVFIAAEAGKWAGLVQQSGERAP
jgi:tripartite-type tricarboxylate transporter receptor subunit TctC